MSTSAESQVPVSPLECESDLESDGKEGLVWQDKLFNISVIILPCVLILPICVWILQRLELLTIPSGSKFALFMTVVHYVVLVTGAIFAVIFFLLAVTTRKKPTSRSNISLTYEPSLDFDFENDSRVDYNEAASRLAFDNNVQSSRYSSIFVVMNSVPDANCAAEIRGASACTTHASPRNALDHACETNETESGLNHCLSVDEGPPSYEDAVSGRSSPVRLA